MRARVAKNLLKKVLIAEISAIKITPALGIVVSVPDDYVAAAAGLDKFLKHLSATLDCPVFIVPKSVTLHKLVEPL